MRVRVRVRVGRTVVEGDLAVVVEGGVAREQLPREHDLVVRRRPTDHAVRLVEALADHLAVEVDHDPVVVDLDAHLVRVRGRFRFRGRG